MRTGGRAGFTLLEFLIAMVIFGLLMALLVQGGRVVFGYWERASARNQLEERLWSSVRLMQRQMLSAVPLAPPGGPPRGLAFWGQGDQVTFVTCLSLGSRGRLGLWVVNYSLKPGEEGLNLEAREWAGLDAAWWSGDPGDPTPVILLSGLEGAGFSYQYYDELRRRSEYLESWDSAFRGRLPQSVRLSMNVGDQEVVWELPLACGGD